MSVDLITVNLKFQNRFTYSNGPTKRPGKVCGDFQDLKSPDNRLISLHALIQQDTPNKEHLRDINPKQNI